MQGESVRQHQRILLEDDVRVGDLRDGPRPLIGGPGRPDPSGSTDRPAVQAGDATAGPVVGTTGAILFNISSALGRSLVRC